MEGLGGRGQLRVQERHCPANKSASLLYKHNGKEQDSGNKVIIAIMTITKPDYQ